MTLPFDLASLGLHSLAAAAELTGGDSASRLSTAIGGLLRDRLSDASQRLSQALNQATARTWSALEAALAGESLRQRLVALTARAEDRVFAGQLRTFLATVPLGDTHDTDDAARRKALAELRHARNAGLLAPTAPEPLARFANPDELIDARDTSLRDLAAGLHAAGYIYLARVLAVRPIGGEPLLVVALSYFFRRAVESDGVLFRGLAVERLGNLQAGVESGFAALELALDLHGDRLAGLLDDVFEALSQTRDAVLDLRAAVSGQSEQLRAIGDAVLALLEQHRLHRREVRPGDSLTVRDDGERQAVRQLVGRYRALPAAERSGSPALLNAVGKLEVMTGDFDDAQRDFETVAGLVQDGAARAEAHFNAYRACLERRDWPAAMRSLTAALAHDPRRFAPLPLDAYAPERILGAGGFGVAFLCRHRYMNAPVVVKSLWLEPLGLAADRVFTEAKLLRELDHANVIRLSDCGYVDAVAEERPYLVMDYFEAETLEAKTLPLEDYIAVARQVAEGLRAAHQRGILHRDVKPANLLAHCDGDGWRVKIIDFGLAIRDPAAKREATTTRAANTLRGTSVAGTLSYAAPEQLHGDEARSAPRLMSTPSRGRVVSSSSVQPIRCRAIGSKSRRRWRRCWGNVWKRSRPTDPPISPRCWRNSSRRRIWRR